MTTYDVVSGLGYKWPGCSGGVEVYRPLIHLGNC